ncbi:hypothetical protein [Terriglobus albidus]|uniref:hypothetical protein n=1 Tax=Terriglobus albidus TaxID=1592106 RepID=UPI0021DF47FD|nr:hypothetical protein [Terriglobus albidus]
MPTQHHDGLPDRLTLSNIADGALYELLDRELKRVAENINDPNTSEKQKRRITVNLEFAPYPDRTGAAVSTSIKSTLAGVKAVESTMYIAKKNGEWLTFPKNTKQTEIQFGMADAVTADEATKAN